MLVSHRKKFIYTKTAKTASTSVESFFEPYCMESGKWTSAKLRNAIVSPAGIIGHRGKLPRFSGWPLLGPRWYDHMPAARIRSLVGQKIWDSYFKFCVVRNPFEKVVSGFHFFEELDRRNLRPLGVPQFPTLQERFANWVETQVARKKILFDRNRFVIKGEVCVDYVIKYEDLNNGVRHVCQQVNVPFDRDLPRMVTGFRPPGHGLEQYYDDRTKALVARTYDFEIEYFGYEYPVDSTAGAEKE